MKIQKRKRFAKTTLFLLAGMLSMTCGCAEKKDAESLFELAAEESADSGDEGKKDLSDVNAGDPQEEVERREVATSFVHICGEVVCPGVYEVPSDCRIYDVVMLAGGFTEEASQDYLNLAAPVSDGMQIRILTEAEAEEEKKRQANEALGLININTASLAELCTLPGIGESRAKDIITYRTDNGAFASPEEIMQVSGIKDTMYEKIKDKICVE